MSSDQYLKGNWLKGYSMDPKKRDYNQIAESLRGLEMERQKKIDNSMVTQEQKNERDFLNDLESDINYQQVKELGEKPVPKRPSIKFRHPMLDDPRVKSNPNYNIIEAHNTWYDSDGGKRRTKRRGRKRRGGMMVGQRRPITDVVREITPESVVTLDFNTPESLAIAFENAIKDIKNANQISLMKTGSLNKNRTMFILLIIMGVYSFLQPSQVPALTGDVLESARTTYMRQIVSEYTATEVENKMKLFSSAVSQTRFVFQNSAPMTSAEIMDFLKTNSVVRPVIESVQSAIQTLSFVGGETSTTINAIYGMFFGKKTLMEHMENFKNLGGSVTVIGLLTFAMFITMKITSPILNLTNSIISKFSNSTTRRLRETQRYFADRPTTDINTIMIMKVDGRDYTVTLDEIREIIDMDKSPIMVSTIDWFLAKLFEHEEAWTVEDEDESVGATVQTLHTALTNETARSLETVSTIGYGDDLDRISKFISEKFGAPIQQAMQIATIGCTNLYESLLKTTGYTVGREETDNMISSQGTEISDITMESEKGLRFNDLQIETMTIDAVVSSVQHSSLLTDREKRSVVNQLTITDGEFAGRTAFGGRHRRRHLSHIHKTKRRLSKKYKKKTSKRRR